MIVFICLCCAYLLRGMYNVDPRGELKIDIDWSECWCSIMLLNAKDKISSLSMSIANFPNTLFTKVWFKIASSFSQKLFQSICSRKIVFTYLKSKRISLLFSIIMWSDTFLLFYLDLQHTITRLTWVSQVWRKNLFHVGLILLCLNAFWLRFK